MTDNKFTAFMRKTPGYIKASWKNFSFIYIFVVLFVLYACIESRFNWNNITNIFKHTAVIGTIALGMGLIIISGDIDLSVGSNFAFTGGLTIWAYNSMVKAGMGTEISMFISIILAVAIGATIGFINGFLVGKVKIPAFIATLSTMLIFRSLCQYMCPKATGGGSASTYTIYKTATIPSPWTKVNENIPGIEFPWVAVLLIVLVIAVWLFTKYTKFGRKIYAIGSNSRAASLAGINVPWSKTTIFAIAGGLVGVAVFLHISIRGAVESNSTGQSYELFAIASCIIGGIAMSGGKGNIIGILFGALSFTMIDKIIVAAGADPLVNNTIKGAILLLAVMLQLIQGSTIKGLGLRIKSWFVPEKKLTALAGEAAETTTEEKTTEETTIEESSDKEEL